MSGEQFRAWQEHMGYSNTEAAAAIGVHYNTITRYRDKGTEQPITLACMALFFDVLKPWPF